MHEEDRANSFDELARGLASGSISRGRTLRLMGAALVGGALASVGIGEAAADDCKRNGKVCKKDKQCCSRNCDDVTGKCAPACTSNGGSCGIDSDCCSGLLCDNGTCATCRSVGGTCSSNDQCCSGFCVNDACRPAGFIYNCNCQDGQQLQTCSPASCGSSGIEEVCENLCAEHGGRSSGSFCFEDASAC